jgi:hypothetical protein
MENHNLTQPSGLSGSPAQLLGNPAAPYLNSLMTPGNPNAAQTSFASNYYNVLFNDPSVSIHPSEPNYVWEEAGLHGPLNDADPFPNNIVNAPNLSGLLQAAGISWKSYQEDIDLIPTSGTVNQPGANSLTSGVVAPADWTVPLHRFSGTSDAYTNFYNGSHQYDFAPKHDGTLFFIDTNGGNNPTSSNPERRFYAPLQQLRVDLGANTVARYSVITPDQFNDMHSFLRTGFTYQGVHYTGDQAAIAEGDNFLSIVVPEIMASRAYQNNGAIVIWYDETEDGNTTQFTLPEIVISPLAKGNAFESTLTYTHSSDLKSLQQLFNVSAPGGGFLGDANTPGTNDLSDFFKPGALTPTSHPVLGSSQAADPALSSLAVALTGNNQLHGAINLTTTTGFNGSSSLTRMYPGVTTITSTPVPGLRNASTTLSGAQNAASVQRAADLIFAHGAVGDLAPGDIFKMF